MGLMNREQEKELSELRVKLGVVKGVCESVIKDYPNNKDLQAICKVMIHIVTK